jgi:hypothetical protein
MKAEMQEAFGAEGEEMTSRTRTFENVVKVEITEHRWETRFTLTFKDGHEEHFIASADSYLTCGDGIWFGDGYEYEQSLKDG